MRSDLDCENQANKLPELEFVGYECHWQKDTFRTDTEHLWVDQYPTSQETLWSKYRNQTLFDVEILPQPLQSIPCIPRKLPYFPTTAEDLLLEQPFEMPFECQHL